MVATGLKYLDNLALEADRDPELEWELAQAYIKSGNVQGAPRDGPHLGDTAGALASHGKALMLPERLAGRSPDDVKILRALTASYRSFGDLQVFAGRESEAMNAFARAIDAAHAVVGSPRRDAADLRLRGLNIASMRKPLACSRFSVCLKPWAKRHRVCISWKQSR